jgi:hypothetical protein
MSRPRVVSLLPHATDILLDMKLGHLLTGVSHECEGVKNGAKVITSDKAGGDSAQIDAVRSPTTNLPAAAAASPPLFPPLT